MKLGLYVLIFILVFHIAAAAVPTVGSITATTPISLNAGTKKAVSCEATITDLDGYSDITNVRGVLFDSDNAGSSDDKNDHYTDSICTLSVVRSTPQMPSAI